MVWLLQTRDAAEIGSNIQVTNVEQGVFVRSADVRTIRKGRLTIAVKAETVAGTLVGGEFKVIEGGTITADVNVGTVTGDVTGVKIDSLG